MPPDRRLRIQAPHITTTSHMHFLISGATRGDMTTVLPLIPRGGGSNGVSQIPNFCPPSPFFSIRLPIYASIPFYNPAFFSFNNSKNNTRKMFGGRPQTCFNCNQR